MESAEEFKKISFADKMRKWFHWLLNPAAAFLNRIGLHPNTVTLIGLAGTVGVAVLISLDHMTWAGLLLLVMGPVDALDGAMARLRGEASDYGAFVDSVTDRYSELFIYLGFLIHYLLTGDPVGVAFTYLAAAGSVLVSYVKARADASKLDANTGLLTRVERYIVLIPGLVFNLPLAVVIIIAVLANFTALQRILRVRRDAYRRLSQK
ncbi:MAG: CDP-diacylglycerol--glycerol-3-phosphate 3-phosphatidyltransferase [Anaerolineaceae bacterium]|nr:MAG: CDP-diacylglycerol--glycerol-3-phosphate 3-phosphatidyltransferase [Anaerolineaceae bacterium]